LLGNGYIHKIRNVGGGNDKYRIYAELLQLHPSRRRETSSRIIPRLQPCERRTAKEKSITSSHGILWKDLLL
jgi:hypothetical protein